MNEKVIIKECSFELSPSPEGLHQITQHQSSEAFSVLLSPWVLVLAGIRVKREKTGDKLQLKPVMYPSSVLHCSRLLDFFFNDFIFFIYFFFWPHRMWDLSSPTTDQNSVP